MSSLANGISCARILLALALLFIGPLSAAFFAIYVACGLSDVLDGYVARKTGAVSNWGGKLDSAADLTLALIVAIRLYPSAQPALTYEIMVWIVSIGLIRLGALLVVYRKFKTFEILHTYGNKATGVLLFVFPFTLPFGVMDPFVYILCGIAWLSALEELLIHLLSRELQTEKKSIFLN